MADDKHRTDDGSPAADPLRALRSKLRRAGWSILWERLWPRLAPPAAIAAVFLSLAWLRAFDALPDWARLAAVGLFAAAFLAALVPALRVALPRDPEKLSRVERDSGFEHRPLTGLADRQAAGEADPFARALWEAHRRRLAERLGAARVLAPSPRLDRRDPFALRAAVLLLFVVGLVAARGDWLSPVANAVRLPVVPGPEIRIDAWVTPPGYTGRAPIFMTANTGAEADGDRPPAEPLRVPQGSVVSIRVNGVAAPAASFAETGATAGDDGAVPSTAIEAAAIDGAAAAPAGADEDVIRPTAFQTTLDRSGTVTLSSADGDLARYAFAVDVDQPPAIKLVEEPGATARGAFRLAYEAIDDYRVAGAKAVFSEPKTPLDPAIGATGGTPRPLIGAPDMPLSLPRRTAEKKTAETYRDLSAHPWAGGVVDMTLEARDDAGNVGRSEPMEIVIPARPFRHPVARMLIEQRRMLALDANSVPFVVGLLDTVQTYAPDFVEDAAIHIGLSVIRARIVNARSDDDLRSALDFMWEMALAIDGGDASLAEQRLREAREALREALQNGASPEEIARLTEELRKAMQEYMQALQEQMRNNPQLAQPMDPQQMQNAQEVSPQDFQEMIDRIEELSRLGDREAAEELLSQLDRMLENLQMAQPQQGQPQQGQQGQMNQMMNELADMIRRQQELMNETHRMTPDGQPQQGEGMSQEQMEQALRDLQQGQGELQQRLQEMMEGMQQNGMQPGEGLGQAQESMQGAQGSLGQGDPSQALGQQGQALEQLRQGAQQLAEQMGNQEGEGQGEGQGRRGQSAQSEDPLGRPQRRDGPDFGDSVKVPGEIEVQRARRILEELRRRFSDPARPAIELDYLQRLLNPF